MAKRLILILITCYQRGISPLLHMLGGAGSGCRFEPTCSHYFAEAVQVHGALRGSRLGMRRLCRCHPWGGHGYDPVPPPAAEATGPPPENREPGGE